MAFYITKHLPHLGTPPAGHLHLAHSHHPESIKRTIIPTLDSGFPSTTTTRLLPTDQHPFPTAINLSTPNLHQQRQPQQQQPIHPLSQETLTHLLHNFYTHQHDTTSTASGGCSAHPLFDLDETRSCYTIYGDLPGLQRQDVVVVTDDLLYTVTVSGTLTRQTPGEVDVREGVELVAKRGRRRCGGA